MSTPNYSQAFTRAMFDNPGVLESSNPSNFGYHYGPIPNPNPDYVPDAVQDARDRRDAGERPVAIPIVSAQMNNAAPNPGSRLSSVNFLVCDIDMGGGEMCGQTVSDQPSLRRHLRNAHPGAVTNNARTNVSTAERLAGQNALKWYVLSRGWRNAHYINEPGMGQVGSLVRQYCDFLEALAQRDDDFSDTFGRHFHRRIKHDSL